MKKNVVIYYSNTGSNQYLAEKIAKQLECHIEAIRPRGNGFPVLLMLSNAEHCFSLQIIDGV